MDEEIEKFSEDPEENLRMENEFLKMKIAVQHGGKYGEMDGLPPEIENQFLKTVLEFESRLGSDPNLKKIGDILGNPQWTPSADMLDVDLEVAIDEVNKRLNKHAMKIDFLASYPNRVIYEFLIGEMMEYETDVSFHMEGMTMNLIYEEFHPNHAYDIENGAKFFVENWFKKEVDGLAQLLPDGIPVEMNEVLLKNDVVKKISNLFDAFEAFKDCAYYFLQTSYDFEEDAPQGMAYVEGGMRYTAVLENGEEMMFEGDMKLYFSCQGYGWDLMFFNLPGFNWKKDDQ